MFHPTSTPTPTPCSPTHSRAHLGTLICPQTTCQSILGASRAAGVPWLCQMPMWSSSLANSGAPCYPASAGEPAVERWTFLDPLGHAASRKAKESCPGFLLGGGARLHPGTSTLETRVGAQDLTTSNPPVDACKVSRETENILPPSNSQI